MKLYPIVYLIILVFIFLIDFALVRQKSNRTAFQKRLLLLPTVFFVLYFTLVKFLGAYISDYRINVLLMWLNLSFFWVYVPRIVFVVFHFIESKTSQHADALKRVRNLLLGAFFILMAVSAFYTSRSIQVKTVTVSFKNLPVGFNNFKIVQLTDIHLGSRFNDPAFYASLVKKVNAQHPDMIVFTGDMVNNFADEMKGFDSVFRQMSAKQGKFAVLGNHDSGDYSEWKSEAAKAENLDRIKAGFASFGFQLLDNKNVLIRNGGDSIALVGVGCFHKNAEKDLADLTRATKGLNPKEFKILLSHNPDHWERGVETDQSIALTLSGHTHAGQIGLNLFGKVYSPIVLIYNNYNGLYTRDKQYLYVSHGIGHIGLPIMLGIQPEINVIILKNEL